MKPRYFYNVAVVVGLFTGMIVGSVAAASWEIFRS